MYEQLSLFDFITKPIREAVSCFTGDVFSTSPLESWMRSLIPDGDCFIVMGGYNLVLRPVKIKEEKIPEGHQFYHYRIGQQLFSAIGVGAGTAESEEEEEGDY